MTVNTLTQTSVLKFFSFVRHSKVQVYSSKFVLGAGQIDPFPNRPSANRPLKIRPWTNRPQLKTFAIGTYL